MKASELRIGNWVLYDETVYHGAGSKEEFRVTWEKIAEYYYKYWKKTRERNKCVWDEVVTYHKDLINPIPLTEEWLLRFGANFSDIGCYVGCSEFILYNPLREGGASGHKYYGKHWFPMWREHLIGSKPCLYVHQLQNLYFALTGEELEIK